MNKYRTYFHAAVLLIFMLSLSSCGKPDTVTEIPLGNILPVWMLDEAHTVADLPDNAEEQGLIGIYTTDTDRADVYVYSFFREEGVSLEQFRQRLASEHNIFCNMLTDRDVPVVVLRSVLGM